MTVVLGFDESPGAQRALEVAIDVATRWGDDLVIVYAVQAPGAGLGEELRSHSDALHDLARAAVERALAAATERGVSATVELVDEKPAPGLLAVADRHDARVIVVGTWGDAPLRGALLGSTPHKLLHLSRRPVLCVPLAE